ncbi:MAG: PTS transporter subunit EIIC [Bifidobacteriaceae bacterium]|jgi:PTS system cellobiose-specific IIC component|nr:PTS transporter subunit EIIC [Bifidobacteriaceae bacterium]
MDKFTQWMEEHFVPIAAKFGSQKHLVAIRDSFIAIMPVTMAGSVAVLFNAIFRDLMAPEMLNLPAVPEAMEWLITIDGSVWWGTIAMFALIFSFSIGYHVAKAYGVNEISAGLVSTAAYITITPQTASASLSAPEGGAFSQTVIDEITAAGGTVDATGISLGAWGNLNVSYLNAGGLFTAMILGLIGTIIFAKIIIAKITIKLPEMVPPAVSQAFAAIIPGAIVIFGAGLLSFILGKIHEANPDIPEALADLIAKFIQQPFLGASQGIGWVVLVVFMVQFLWFFGLHGASIMTPVLSGTYLPALLENNAVWEQTHDISQFPYLWTSGSFDLVWQGGSGASFALLIAILVFSKREEYRMIAKLATPMGVFEINEPVVFGLPIVLNPIFVIPWLLVPCILAVITYAATAIGFMPPPFIQMPWITPPIIIAFMASGFSWQAAVVALIDLAVAFAIWSIFVIVANGMVNKEQGAEEGATPSTA